MKKILGLKEQIELFSLLSALSASGRSASEVLKLAQALLEEGKLKEGVVKINLGLQKGENLAVLFATRSFGLPPLVPTLLSLGAQVGKMASLFEFIRSYLSERKQYRSELAGALAYPCMILFTLVFGLLGLSSFVLPGFKDFAGRVGGEGQKELENLSQRFEFLIQGVPITFVVFALFLIFVIFGSRYFPNFALLKDRVFLSLPILGNYLKTKQLYDLCFTLQLLCSYGVPLHKALDESLPVLKNRALHEALANAKTQVEGGLAFSKSLMKGGLFPASFIRWIALGEKTGKPALVFSELKDFFRKDLESKHLFFSKFLEPAMTVLVGLFLLLFIVFFILPFFSVYSAFL